MYRKKQHSNRVQDCLWFQASSGETSVSSLFSWILLLVPEGMPIDTVVKATESPRFSRFLYYCAQTDSTWSSIPVRFCRPRAWLCFLLVGLYKSKVFLHFRLFILQQNALDKIFTLLGKGNTNSTFWFITNESMKILNFFPTICTRDCLCTIPDNHFLSIPQNLF